MKISTIALFTLVILTGESTAVAMTSEETITTTAKDAFPVAVWLDDVMSIEQPLPWNSRVMPAGYWTVHSKSYCLHAGKSGPVHGSGYVMAAAKGARSALILRLLSASMAHNDINQHDIQQLIWSIEAVTPFDEMPPRIQGVGRTLLSREDIESLRQGEAAKQTKGFLSQLSGQLQNRIPGSDKLSTAMDFATRFRAMLTDPNATYEQIAAVAVPVRVAPLAPATDIGRGNWTSAGRRYYMRALPRGYTETELEFVRAKMHDVHRDAFDRITHWSGTFGSVDVTYANHDSSPLSPFQEVVFQGNKPDQNLTVRGTGFAIASEPTASGRGVDCPAALRDDCSRRVAWLTTFYRDVISYRQAKKLPPPDASLIAYHPRLDFALGVADVLSSKAGDVWLQVMRTSLRSEEAGVGCLWSADCAPPRSASGARTAGRLLDVAARFFSVIESARAQAQPIPWCSEQCYTNGDQPQLPPDCEPLNAPPQFITPTDEEQQRLGGGGSFPTSAGQMGAIIGSIMSSLPPSTDCFQAASGVRG
jgi:hypothetical protein